MVTGVQFLAIGLVSEILMRIYFEAQDKKIYSVRKICKRALTDKVTGSGEGPDAAKYTAPHNKPFHG
jgi:hypothetical protein